MKYIAEMDDSRTNSRPLFAAQILPGKFHQQIGVFLLPKKKL